MRCVIEPAQQVNKETAGHNDLPSRRTETPQPANVKIFKVVIKWRLYAVPNF
jgi:hypothetical protein